MKFSRYVLLGMTAMVAGLLWFSHSEAAAPAISDDAFKSLLNDDVKAVNKALDALNADAKAASKKGADRAVVSSAMTIAFAAQAKITGGADDAKFATIRDAAIKVATATKKKDFKSATEAAKNLDYGVKPDPKADTKPVKLVDALGKDGLTVDETMQQFKKPVGFGVGAEEEIKANSKKLVADPARATAIATRVLALAEYSKVHNDGKTGAKLAEWQKFNSDMEAAANELIKAAGAKNNTEIQAAFKKIDGRCTACHNVFKN